LTGIIPYSGYDNDVPSSDIRARGAPERPSDGTTDPILPFLRECWTKYHNERPSATRVYNTLSKFRTVEELPEKLELRVQSIKISFTGTRRQQFYVKFRYGDEVHTISLTKGAATGDEYAWFALCPSSRLSLNLGQELSGTLVDNNH